MITNSDVRAAAARIAGHVRSTPLIETDPGAFPPAARVWLKLEQFQHTGSFKVRGAVNRILSAAEQGTLPAAGVVAASGGNAGLAAAYAAARHGLPARVYVPDTAPPVKVARLREYGAEVVQGGATYADAYEAGDKSVDLTKVMLEVQKAGLAFRAMTEVRNKLIDAYTQVMNMSV